MLGHRRIEHALSVGARNQAIIYNEVMKQNRFILERLVEIVCSLGTQELIFLGHFEEEYTINASNYLVFLDLLARQKQYI